MQPASPDRLGGPSRHGNFGASAPLSLGIEEEILLVDGDLRLLAAADTVVERVPDHVAGGVSTEIFAAQIELKTGICHGPGDALAELVGLRAAVGHTGAGLLAVGLHPLCEGEPELISSARYDRVRADLGTLILNTPPCGLHVHVGAPDPEAAIRLVNAFRRYLPALGALSANSPFRAGADTGHASARTSIVRGYPRFQVPREFRDYEDYLRVADELIAAAGVEDYTYVWWDVRPHPRLGTVEVRAVDVQTSARDSAAIGALVQAIAARELHERVPVDLSREALEESYFQAASHGLEAEILLDSGTPEPAPVVCRRMLDSVRPFARELGSEDALGELDRILRDGNGADRQRRFHARRGMSGLLEDLAARTR